jgi:hypothetical protein
MAAIIGVVAVLKMMQPSEMPKPILVMFMETNRAATCIIERMVTMIAATTTLEPMFSDKSTSARAERKGEAMAKVYDSKQRAQAVAASTRRCGQ